jgi:hypothetical protein
MKGEGEKQATYHSRCRCDTFTPPSLEHHTCLHITHNPLITPTHRALSSSSRSRPHTLPPPTPLVRPSIPAIPCQNELFRPGNCASTGA